MPIYPLQYHAFVSVLAGYRLHDQVDAILTLMFTRSVTSASWIPNRVLLGNLVNAAAEQLDFQRAEGLWERFLSEFNVKPCSVEYGCLIKAHVLCGRPHAAACVVEDMFRDGVDMLPIQAQDHLQALLIVYHSSLARRDKERLAKSVKLGEAIVMAPQGSSPHMRTTWKNMKVVAGRLQLNPKSVRFSDLLIEWKSSQRSVMADWKCCIAGTNYLNV